MRVLEGPAPLYAARRPVRWRWAALALAVAALGSGCQPTPARMEGRILVTASSTAAGSSAGAVVDTESGSRTGAHWTAGEAGPAWIEVRWPSPQPVRKVVLANADSPESMVRAGFLTFSDGSSVQVRLSDADPLTTVAVAPRAISWLRFTVSAVADPSRPAALAEIVLNDTVTSEDVTSDAEAGGNAAASATPAASASTAGSDAEALKDGDHNSPVGAVGDAWSTPAILPSWAELAWTRPREIAAVQLFGSKEASARIVAGELHFGDGSVLPVGGVVNDPARPTTVAFMPRSTASVRFVVTRVDGAGTLALAEMRALQAGHTPGRAPTASRHAKPVDPPCPTPARPVAPPAGQVTVSCATVNAPVSGPVTVPFTAPGVDTVTATVWAAEAAVPASPETEVPVRADGTGEVPLDLRSVPRGPVTLRLTPSGRPSGNPTYVQLYNAGPAFVGPDATPASDLAAGRTLVYADEFTELASTTRDGSGADYSSAKPEYWGPAEFGEAIFADPSLGLGNLTVVDQRYLRMSVSARPPGFADPEGWGRQHIGALLASARTGGSGFAAQYGYFEARMLAPAGQGVWPAFWTLPSTNLTGPDPQVAEVDAVELYGHRPAQTCHSTHAYADGKDSPLTKCLNTHATPKDASGWHTYGVWVTPAEVIYYVDGRQVFSAPQVAAGDRPMFFLLDLALGGGWPIDLGRTGQRASLYVDYVRVYV